MGWTSFNMKRPVKEWFKDEWNSEKYEVIDSALVRRNTLYGAIRIKETGEIFCAIFLIRWSRSYYNFCYKDMTEHSGPNVVECPQRIMKLLSPLDDTNDPNGWARAWRRKVESFWAKREKMKKKRDAVIKSNEPINFRSGDNYQFFKKVGRTLWGGFMHNGEFVPICRVRVNLSHYDYEFIENNLAVS
jgi:hypothetical protein